MSKYVIRRVSTGLKFDLRAGNGETILTSEVYVTYTACYRGIASVRRNGAITRVEDQTVADYPRLSNPKYELYQDRAGEYRFRLRARNGNLIGASEGYSTKAACLNGINSVRVNAGATEIEK